MYLSSTYVKAFPLGRPRATTSNDITSRIFYEQTVSNIIRQLIDVEGFIITGSTITNESGKLSSNLEINIGGYYFNIDSAANVFQLNTDGAIIDNTGRILTNSTVYIYFCTDLTENEPREVIGQDSTDGNYQGLILEMSTVKPGTYNEHTYQVPIFVGQTDGNGRPIVSPDNTWVVYEDSYIKFDVDSLSITGIDGKH